MGLLSVFTAFLLVMLCSPKGAVFDRSIVRGKPVIQRLLLAVFGPRGLIYPCRFLRSTPQQQRNCLRNSEIRKLVQDAAQVAKSHCQEQFRFSPWACSPHYRNITFLNRDKMYRETAVLYAIYSAALVQVVSRACAQGRLEQCRCTGASTSYVQSAWEWGVCGDNFVYGRRFARRFLQLSQVGMDPLGSMVRHNSEVGIQAVSENIDNLCKCHGVSGSCSMRTCWTRLKDFKNVALQLKHSYHTAVLQTLQNNIRPLKASSKPRKELYYLEKSPNFCSGTHGRQCQSPANCATLCCGRGYMHHSKQAQEYCKCRWKSESFNIECSVCTYMQEIFICK